MVSSHLLRHPGIFILTRAAKIDSTSYRKSDDTTKLRRFAVCRPSMAMTNVNLEKSILLGFPSFLAMKLTWLILGMYCFPKMLYSPQFYLLLTQTFWHTYNSQQPAVESFHCPLFLVGYSRSCSTYINSLWMTLHIKTFIPSQILSK